MVFKVSSGCSWATRSIRKVGTRSSSSSSSIRSYSGRFISVVIPGSSFSAWRPADFSFRSSTRGLHDDRHDAGFLSYFTSTPLEHRRHSHSTTTPTGPGNDPHQHHGQRPSLIRGPCGAYEEQYQLSIRDPVSFWQKAAEQLTWFQKPSLILEETTATKSSPSHALPDQLHPSNENVSVKEEEKSKINIPHYRWFSDGVLNTCYNCLDVQVQQHGRGAQVALYYDSPMTGLQQQITYQQLLDQVATLAGALTQQLGVQAGDRVLIYMPMIPQAAVAMLACTRIGAVHSVVFGGFAAKELATRLTDCQPVVVISASAGMEPPQRIVPYQPLLNKALEMAQHDAVQHVVVVQRPEIRGAESWEAPASENGAPRWRCWDYDQLMAQSTPVPATPLPAHHPHYILYTSGTTGIPKGVVRDTGGMAVALKYSMGAFYDTHPAQVFWAASDIGWVVGHSYGVYGPLLQGCSTVMYEGKPVGTPDAGAYWRVVEEYGVNTLFVAPTALRAIKQADPHWELPRQYRLDSLQALFVAGEHCDPDTLYYAERALGIAPIDHWWQTELGHPGIGNALGLGRIPVKHGACAAPAPGFDVRVVDDQGVELPRNQLGNLVIKTPLPPGTLTTLYKNHDRYVREYLTKYPGYYDAGDAAMIDDEGYIFLLGRTDEIINTAGHRLSTGALEEILQSHPDVAECAVIPVKDALKGQVPVGFVVTYRDSTVSEDQLAAELVQAVRDELGPVASFKKVAVVKALPKTRSGKILRGTMSKIADGLPYTITPTIDDPNIFVDLEPIIQKLVAGSSLSTTNVSTSPTSSTKN